MSTAATKRELGGKLAGLSLRRQVWVLAVWPLAEQFMNFLVGTIDLALAGRLDPEGLAIAATDALGVAGYVGWLMGMIHASVGVGAAALISRAIGGRRLATANAALGQAMLIAMGLGFAVCASLLVAAPLFGILAGLEGESLALCTRYLRFFAIAAPASSLLLSGNAALRAAGDTRTPFAVMIFVNIINIAASVLLVFGPAPLGGRGVAGIAMGTVIAWICGAVVVMVVISRGVQGGLRLRLQRLRPHWHTLRRILRVGLPNMLEATVGMWLGNFLVLRIVSELGIPGAVGAHMITIRVESASFLPGVALGIAAAVMVGQYLGLGDADRAGQAVRIAWKYAALLMSALGFVFYFFPEPLVRLITDADVLVNQAVVPICIAAFIQPFFATQVVLGGALRGAGDTRATFAITACSTFLLRVPLCYYIGVVLGHGLNGIWVALCIEMVFRSGLFAMRFLWGNWRTVEV